MSRSSRYALDVREAARRLGVSQSTIRRWIRTGRLNPDCYAVYDRLFPYLDRELSAEETIEVELHLKACADC